MGKLKTFGENVIRGAHMTGLRIRKASPTILIGAGIVGMISAAVMACKAMKKVPKIKEKFEKEMDTIEKASKEGGDLYPEEYRKKDVVRTYAKTGWEYVKAFGPAFLVGMASTSCLLASHKIMSDRNAALSVTATAIDQAFKRYRERVKSELGEEMDKKFRYGLKAEEIEIVKKDEDGNEEVESVQSGGATASMYARWFDHNSKYWEKIPSYNLNFLKQAQQYLNDRLRIKGHVFLNEVYDYLDIPHSKEGAVVGWVYGCGDSYIDFGIFDWHDERRRRFVNGEEACVLLDFNVDGVIFDKI